jgi:hypothetical protein
MAFFTCKFTNNTNLSVQMGLFGKDHEYRTADPLGPHSSETTDVTPPGLRKRRQLEANSGESLHLFFSILLLGAAAAGSWSIPAE